MSHFPYMAWARESSFAAPYSLAQSGMPAPDPLVLGPPPPPELASPLAGALEAFSERLAGLFGVSRERVVVTPGASGAMLLAAMRFFPGARVVTETPSYEPFRALPALFQGEPVLVTRRHADGFRLDPDAVRQALAPGRRPAHLFLCTPHNPSGDVLSAGELCSLAASAERAGGVLVSNEIYMEFAQPEERVHAALLAGNAVSIGSLTKAYGLGALRVGWMLLGEGLVREREALQDLLFLVSVDLPTPSLRLGARALEHLPELLLPARRMERECRPHLVRWLRESELVEGGIGPLGLAAFPRVLGVDDTRALAQGLVARHGVGVVPGEFFGLPGHVRVGYGVPEATLVEGLQRLETGLAELAPGPRA